MCVAAVYGKINIMWFLVKERSTDVNSPMDDGLFSLYYAAQHGHLAVVRCLVKELGADVNKTRHDGCTTLFVAAAMEHSDVALCLARELGANVNQASKSGKTSLHMAADKGSLDLLQCFVEEFDGDINQETNNGVTPLFCAAQGGHLAAVRYLTERLGVNSDRGNAQRALYIAAQNGHLDVTKCLANELGADVNKGRLGNEGIMPLMAASKHKRDEIVRWLLKNGANAQAKNEDSATAADISKYFGAPAESTAYLEARTHCAKPGCGGAGLKKCAKCLEVFFCSKDCQIAHCPAHKADCKRRVRAKEGKEK
jgi:ankyrin repeat protein